MKARFAVTVETLGSVERSDLLTYVMDAVSTMKGCYAPNDPARSLTRVVVRDERTTESIVWEDPQPFYLPDWDPEDDS